MLCYVSYFSFYNKNCVSFYGRLDLCVVILNPNRNEEGMDSFTKLLVFEPCCGKLSC